LKTDNFIPNDISKIGVMVSGGLDSSLLLYLITKENKDKGFPVEVVTLTVHRPDNAKDHAKRIISLVERLNNITLQNIEVGDPNTSPDLQVISGIKDSIMNKDIPLVFIATTAIPEHLKDARDVPQRDTKEYLRLSQPWGHETKDSIVEYVVRNKLEVLIKHSHSCTGLQLGQCGRCYNCLERKWALDCNSILDSTEY